MIARARCGGVTDTSSSSPSGDPRLDLTVYPYLPRATVATTSARTNMDLLTGVVL